MDKRKFVIGLDIGGTKTECCLFELSAEDGRLEHYLPHKKYRSIGLVERQRIATDSSLGLDQFTSGVSNLIFKSCEKSSISFNDIISIGIGMPGSIDPKSGVMHNGNTKMFVNQNFGAKLAADLNTSIPIHIYNDANCFAIAESLSGAGHLHASNHEGEERQFNSVGIILGTGVGGGIVLNGHCLVGNRGGAGELGHTLFVKDGIPCYCGLKGCVERYLSGVALESFYYDLTGERASGQEIFSLASKSDADAIRIIDEYKENLALFLINLANIFDLDFAVLGGGVSQQDLIYEDLESRVNSGKFIKSGGLKVYKHQISDSSGAMGAALLSLNS